MKKSFLGGLGLWLAVTLNAGGALRLAPVFSDHLVLQRDQPVPVWGEAAAGLSVSVAFGGQTAGATADAAGRWRATLAPLSASGEPRTLTVSAGAEQLSISDVLVGEVWLCAGQSNMEWPVEKTDRAAEEIAAAAAHPQIRLLTVPKATANRAQTALGRAAWQVGNPDTVKNFSATAYYFGRDIQRALGVPVGLINASWSGAPIEPFIRADWLRGRPEFAELLAYRDGRVFADDQRDREFVEEQRRILWAWQDQIGALITAGAEPDPAWFRPDWQPDASWRPLALKPPGNLEAACGADADGAFVTRKVFTVSAAVASGSATLKLGAISDYDITWLNGSVIGGMRDPKSLSSRFHQRVYPVPAGLLRAGENTLVVRVFNREGRALIGSGEPNIGLVAADGEFVSLLGDGWQVRLEHDLGHCPPHLTGDRHFTTGVLYDSMIAPLVPYAMRGVIWYQGETNAPRARQYRALFPALINNWRHDWGAGDFPFYYVQLPNHMARYNRPTESDWADLREAQTLALSVPNTGMIVTTDLGGTTELHPANKQEFSRRLALLALAKTYGQAGLEYSGPVFRELSVSGSQVTLSFSHTGKGLVNRHAGGGDLAGFAIAGADRKFYFAKAVISGGQVIVSAPEVPAPVAVRYAWASNPEADLFNADGLPARPFRTDDWPRP